ncbi:sensor histidine kinase [Hymenobacter sp. B1770]|uniref:sensor histidine kinase n=1 Tax=Hymenobacter sp. B1770 TaxID=1718788 RepID=UPI003CE6A166
MNPRIEGTESATDLSASPADIAVLHAQVAQLDRLASVGQLTAGILHEIKNPLNFVSNYATLSADLLTDLVELSAKWTATPEAGELGDLLTMLNDNIGRIRENAQRAERLIQSMLAQNRDEGPHFAPTALNVLLEEFTKLAYQGIRAGDQDFVVSLVFQLDPAMGEVALAPYEFNRVVLNLVLNACYAVNERRKSRLDQAYKPTITVSSQRLSDHLEVKIRDNGDGIPAAVKEKLFTPFFTTKPMGKGTGLGLSLSQRIVNEIHHGTLTVESVPGVYTEFTIQLPLS